MEKKENRKNFDNKKILGFWIYLMSDLILFACLFATYIIFFNDYKLELSNIKKHIFNIKEAYLQSIILLLSSVFFSFISHKKEDDKNHDLILLIITFLFGSIFSILEFKKIIKLNLIGFKYNKNSFFSSYYVLLCMHEIHIIFALCWIIVMIIHNLKKIQTFEYKTYITCLNMFWHFLEIIWILIFIIVYISGNIRT